MITANLVDNWKYLKRFGIFIIRISEFNLHRNVSCLNRKDNIASYNNCYWPEIKTGYEKKQQGRRDQGSSEQKYLTGILPWSKLFDCYSLEREGRRRSCSRRKCADVQLQDMIVRILPLQLWDERLENHPTASREPVTTLESLSRKQKLVNTPCSMEDTVSWMVNQQDTRTPIGFVLEKSAVSFSWPLFLFTDFHEHFNFLSLTLRKGDCILWFPHTFCAGNWRAGARKWSPCECPISDRCVDLGSFLWKPG